MFWPLDQTDIALDALDGLLEVSHGSVTWLATQEVAIDISYTHKRIKEK